MNITHCKLTLLVVTGGVTMRVLLNIKLDPNTNNKITFSNANRESELKCSVFRIKELILK